MARSGATPSGTFRSVTIGRRRTYFPSKIRFVDSLQQINALRSEVEQMQMEKRAMAQLQEQMLERMKKDIEAKSQSEEENLLNTKLQQSVDELNVNSRRFLSVRPNRFLAF